MKRFKTLHFVLFASLLLVFGLTACNDDEDNNITPAVEDNIVELASDNNDLSSLVTALSKFDDLVTLLSDEQQEFTVFAPTNEAFDNLLAAIGQTSIDDVPEDVLRRILEYHVIAGATVRSTDLTDGQTAGTALGEDISISTTDGVTINGSASVIAADVDANNGVVHVIDAVLVPAAELSIVGTIVAPAYFNKEFTTLIAAVNAADEDILSVLLGNGPSDNGLTLFAPSNDAFEAAGITELPDGATLSAVLKYHVIDGTVNAADLPSTNGASAKIGTIGGDFFLSNKGNGVFINGTTEVTATDISGSNGVVHLINRTLLPSSQNVVEIAIEAGFNKLAEALTEANLVDALTAEGDFTVFAPTDAAFDALYSALGVTSPSEIDDATLEAVLLYHVAGGARVFSTDLADGATVTTLSDNTFKIVLGDNAAIEDNDPESANSAITQTDILGTNGVIHVIDNVILPIDL